YCFVQLLQFLEPQVQRDPLQAQPKTAANDGGASWWTPGRWIAPTIMACPSDANSPKLITAGWSESPGGEPETSQGFSGNYLACAGSTVFNPPADPLGLDRNGIFFGESRVKMKDVLDGTSHTLLIGEIVVVPDTNASAAVSGGNTSTQKHDMRGRYWNVHQGNTLFSTLYPPNSTVGDRLTWCIDLRPAAPCQGTGSDNLV